MTDITNSSYIEQARQKAQIARNEASHSVHVAGGEALLDPAKILTKLDLIKESAVIADLGVGSMPYFSMQAAKMAGSGAMVYIVDVQKAALTASENHLKMAGVKNIFPVWSDLETVGATKIPAESVDVCFIVNVLFQSSARAEMLKEACRLMKKGGKLLVIDYKAGTPFVAVNMLVNKNSLIDMAKQAGLVLENDFEAGKNHFGLVFIKS